MVPLSIAQHPGLYHDRKYLNDELCNMSSIKKRRKTLMCFQVAESADRCMANALDMILGLALHVACPGFRQPVLAREREARLFFNRCSTMFSTALLCFAVLCSTLLYSAPL